MKQSQIIALEAKIKADTTKEVTALHRRSKSQELFQSMLRNYTPLDDEGERLPDEFNLIQERAEDHLLILADQYTRLFDITATKEETNRTANADVVVDGTIVLTCVPVTTLLFLEKQLAGVKTFVDALPTLDPRETWTLEGTNQEYITAPTTTARTKKEPRVIELSPPTKEHKAQVHLMHEDKVVGNWTKVRRSSSLSEIRKNEILERIRKLTEAVISARRLANTIEACERTMGQEVFSFLFDA